MPGTKGRSGGARAGAGRPPAITEAAWRLQRATAREPSRQALTESELAVSLAATRAALTDLEAEAARRRNAD
jgi:hypothetical protein